MKKLFIWIKNYLNHPLEIGAVLPTSRFASRLMSSEINKSPDNVIVELGSGTGKITREILNRGVKEKDLILVEVNENFSKILKSDFPNAKIITENAISFLSNYEKNYSNKITHIISGIPLVSMTEENRDKLCELSIKNLDSKGKFIQITYFLRCSFSKKIINQYNLKKKLVGLSILNVPPAFVWKIEK